MKTIQVPPEADCRISLQFTGIVTYAAHLYERDGDNWRLNRTLEPWGSSADHRADDFEVKTPPAGTRLLIRVMGTLSTPGLTGTASATTSIHCNGEDLGNETVSKTFSSGGQASFDLYLEIESANE